MATFYGNRLYHPVVKTILLQVAGGIFLIFGTAAFTLLFMAAVSLHKRVAATEADLARANNEIATLIGWTADLQTNIYELRRR